MKPISMPCNLINIAQMSCIVEVKSASPKLYMVKMIDSNKDRHFFFSVSVYRFRNKGGSRVESALPFDGERGIAVTKVSHDLCRICS